MDTDYKNVIENEILSGMLFEDDISVDDKEHFSVAPNDIVKVDLRPFIQNFESNMRTLLNTPFNQVNIDDVNDELSVGDAPAASQGASNGDQSGEEASPEVRSNVVDFLRMLKANGAWEKLATIDDKTKNKIAKAVLRALTATPKKKKPTNTAAPSPTAAKPDTSTPQRNTGANGAGDPAFNEEENILKEALSILEADASYSQDAHGNIDPAKAAQGAASAGKKREAPTDAPDPNFNPEKTIGKPDVPAATKPNDKAAQPAQPAQPAQQSPDKPTTQDPSKAKFGDVLKNPKAYGLENDESFKAKSEKFNTMKKDYTNYKGIPGAKDTEILGLVKSSDDASGKVMIDLLKRTQTGNDGKAKYGPTGKQVEVPINSIKRRVPKDDAKKKGLFSFLGI